MSRLTFTGLTPPSTGRVGIWETLQRSFISRIITSEHVCYPPENGVAWREVSSVDAVFHHVYVCPECGQCFRPEQSAPATDRS